MDFGMSLPAPPGSFFSPMPIPQLPRRLGPLDLATSCFQSIVQTMELWVQLKQAGLELLGLGPPPQALMMPPPEGNPGQTLLSSGAELGSARGPLLWIWEELENLRRVDFQLLGQLCHLGLEMGALREELITILEEEEEAAEEEEESRVEEEDEGPQGKQEEGHPGVSYPALCLPDFEITI